MTVLAGSPVEGVYEALEVDIGVLEELAGDGLLVVLAILVVEQAVQREALHERRQYVLIL